MKKILSILGIIMAGFLLLMAIALPVKAQSANTTLGADQVYRGFFVRAGEKIEINGTVDGDVWAAGTQVIVNGTVNGSVYAVGQNVVINGQISGNVQAAGAKVEINGKIKGAVYGAGSEVAIDKNANVQNGAMLAGSLVAVEGTIGNQTIVGGSIVKVDSSIDGNLTIQGNEAQLGSDAKVSGNLRYNQDMKITIANDKAIKGSVVKIQDTNKGPSFADRLRDVLLGLLMNILTGLVIIVLLPISAQAVSDYMTAHPFRSFFVGLGFVIFVPVVVVLLLISYFGIQIAVLLGLGFAAILMVGELFVALCIGNFITRPKKVNFASLATSLIIGLIILTVLKLIPYLGGLVAFVSFLIGAGAVAGRTGERLKQIRTAQLRGHSVK